MPGGRPREFDEDTALEAAMRLFWQQGYDGTGIAELTKAMGISPTSLYSTFGNKDELFRRAADRYAAGPSRHLLAALELPTAREVVEQFLRGMVLLAAGQGTPQGCLAVQGALTVSERNHTVHEDLASRRRLGEEFLAERLGRADPVELPFGQDPVDLARYLCSVSFGIAVQAAGGATAEELHRVVDTAVSFWPPIEAVKTPVASGR